MPYVIGRFAGIDEKPRPGSNGKGARHSQNLSHGIAPDHGKFALTPNGMGRSGLQYQERRRCGLSRHCPPRSRAFLGARA